MRINPISNIRFKRTVRNEGETKVTPMKTYKEDYKFGRLINRRKP